MRNTHLRNALLALTAVLPLSVFPVFVKADVNGADPRLTAAPGDDAKACTSCHTGTLNPAGGSVQIILPGPASYTPGVKQHITVKVTDSAQKRWGFELTARLASNPSNSQAGSFTATDANTQVKCDTGRRAPCASDTVIQFATHTSAGTQTGTTGAAQFEFDWTPPATDLGDVILYAAGNAANGNNQTSGDHIYTTSVTLTPAVSAPKPAISENGVTNAANPKGVIAANTWITITGTNLSTATRTWKAADFIDGVPPASLENVSVTVNGKPAYIEYVSPTRINALTPADDAAGPVEVNVTSNSVASDAAYITLIAFAPALFTTDGKFAASTTADNALLDQSEKFFTVEGPAPTVAPGATIQLLLTGLGATDPQPSAMYSVDTALSVLNPVTATVGEIAATVTAAVLVPGSPGVYQVSLQVPSEVPEGELPVIVQINGVSSPAATITIKIPVAQ